MEDTCLIIYTSKHERINHYDFTNGVSMVTKLFKSKKIVMKYMNFLFTGIAAITMACCLVLMFTEPEHVEFATYVFLLAGVLGTVSTLTIQKK